jgi:TP901 family phage tail tape measure protein
MSENLSVMTKFTAHDEASPVVRKLLSNIQRLERGVKNFNSAFGASADAGTAAFGNWSKLTDRLNQSLKASVRGANDYGREWQRNHETRLRGEQRLHASILRLDQIAFNRRMSQHAAITRQQSSLTHREPAPSRMTGSSRYGISPVRTAIVGGIASAGIASVFKRRMEIDTAEVKARIFGELSKDDIKQSRRWIDKDSIKYGVSSGKIVDAFTESLKAGFSRDAAQQIAQGALKAQSAVELDIGQLIKLSGKTATIFGGDVKNTDPARVLKLMNAIAVASAETAADPDEVIEGFKKGNAALAMSKMSEADLAAILSVGISGGIQPSKAGNAVSNLVSTIVGGKSARGQKAQDLNEAARMLGYGGKNNLSDRMTNDPTNVLVEMFQRLNALSEQNKTKVARRLGGSEWDDEILMLAKPVDQIVATLRAVKSKVDMMDKSSAEKLNSLQGRWSSISAAFGLGLEKFGAGFEDPFIEISDWFRSKIDKLDFDSVRRKSKQLVDGFKAAFGIADIKQSLDGMLSKIQSTNVTKVVDFAAGVASGIKSVADSFATAIRSIASVMGKDGNDTAVLGKLTGQIIGLSVALGLLAPVLTVLAGLIGIVRGAALLLGVGTAARIGARTALGVAGGPAAGMALLGDGKPGNSASDITGLQDAIKAERERKRLLKEAGKGDGRADPLFHPTSLRSDIGDKFDKMGAKLERIAFQGGGMTDLSSRNRTGGGIQNAIMGGGSSSGGTGGMTKLLSGVGTPSALFNGVPGSALPNFGIGRSGTIIRRGGVGGIVNQDSIPSFTGGGGSVADNVGAGLSGNAFLAARRGKFAEEMKNDPSLRMHLAAMQQTEGISKGGTIESLMNRADMQGKSLRQMLGYSADGQINPRSFYGPIRRGELGPAIRRLQSNPKEFAKYDGYTQRALAGNHAIGGYTDQGLPTDPNGSKRTGGRFPFMKISPKDGNEFTDWVGPGSQWGKGRAGAMNYRKFIENGIAGSGPVTSNVPSAAENIQNVPMLKPNNDAGLGGRGGRGGSTININGGSHDAESLATLVQRRVDDSMQWRTHDSESEYT